jgi:hypothetical protein
MSQSDPAEIKQEYIKQLSGRAQIKQKSINKTDRAGKSRRYNSVMVKDFTVKLLKYGVQ